MLHLIEFAFDARQLFEFIVGLRQLRFGRMRAFERPVFGEFKRIRFALRLHLLVFRRFEFCRNVGAVARGLRQIGAALRFDLRNLGLSFGVCLFDPGMLFSFAFEQLFCIRFGFKRFFLRNLRSSLLAFDNRPRICKRFVARFLHLGIRIGELRRAELRRAVNRNDDLVFSRIDGIRRFSLQTQYYPACPIIFRLRHAHRCRIDDAVSDLYRRYLLRRFAIQYFHDDAIGIFKRINRKCRIVRHSDFDMRSGTVL